MQGCCVCGNDFSSMKLNQVLAKKKKGKIFGGFLLVSLSFLFFAILNCYGKSPKVYIQTLKCGCKDYFAIGCSL